MAYTSWEGAVAAIRRMIARCDEETLVFASSVGVEVPESLPHMVAVARVRSAVDRSLGVTAGRSSDQQQELLVELAAETSVEVPPGGRQLRGKPRRGSSICICVVGWSRWSGCV